MPEMPQVPGFPGSLGSLGQVKLLHRGTLDRGRPARGPQRGQQQRRLAQVRPAALGPVRAVGAGCDGVQGGDEGGGVGRPVLRFLGHPGGDQRPQRLGHRVQRHRLGQVLIQQPLGRVPGEGRAAGEALVEGGRGRVDIPGRAGRGPGELLGRRVHQGAGRNRLRTGARRDAEIGQLAVAVPVDEHVLRLVVAVHDPAPVRRRQPQQRALQHHQRRLRRSPALMSQDLANRDAVHQLHHDGGARRGLDVLVQPDDVRVIQVGQHLRLGAEHLGPRRVGQERTPQVLDRDQGAGGVVPGQRHITGSARAKGLQLGVPGNAPPGHACVLIAVTVLAGDHRVITHR